VQDAATREYAFSASARFASVMSVPARIAALRAEMTGRALGLMADGMADAALTLRHLCTKSKNEGIRLKASEALLAHGVKLRESVELEERIAALEAKPTQRRTA